jgi:pyruvate/2-oxoglutarate dehydrogenase complex dihydrolipoamide dehydrogenase (E3) component
MSSFDYDIGILGAGAAGLTVASGAAQLGAKTLLIEKEEKLGGDCLHFGCVPSKTLIKTAHVYHLMKNAREFGLPEVEVKPVDFRDVARRIRSVIDDIQKHDSEERFCNLGANVRFGEAEFVDEHSIRLEGKTLSAKNWVIATGSSPAAPSIEGLGATPFITNRELFSLERLPSSMIVLGGGPIGIEMSQAFCRLGTEVTVVQRGQQILSREDHDMANVLQKALEAEGVRFQLNASIKSTKEIGAEKEVVISAAGRDVKLKAEKILVALGRESNTRGLGLEKIGVEFDRKGVKVDRRLRTGHKHIYAAGDSTGAFLFTHAAGYEGGIVISNAIFHVPRKTDYTYMPWCTYTDPEFASIGMNEKRATAEGVKYSVWTERYVNNDRSLAEGRKDGWIKMLLDEKERPIGVQILGLHAGELLGEWVAVMNGRVKPTSLAAAVHPYPTLGELNKKVAGTFLSKKIFSEKVRKGLRFFFHLKGRACEGTEEIKN